LPIVIDDAARIDELIVRPHPGEQLAAVGLEAVERLERIGHVRNVARAILRHLRILIERYRLPVEVTIVLVPMKLRDPERERRQPVENEEVGAAIEAEPD